MRITALSSLACAFSLPAYAASNALAISVDAKSGSYTISSPVSGIVLRAHPAVQVNGKWIEAAEYPSCKVESAKVSGELGNGEESTLHCSGLKSAPELDLRLRTYTARPFGELQLTAKNTTAASLHIQSFRLIEATGAQLIQLGGDAAADRILNDSFSEDRPGMQLHDLQDAEKQMHRAVGSQLIYNQKSHQSWFIGALTSDKFLTVLRLRMAGDHTAATKSYEVDSTGTTELLEENSLLDSPKDDRVTLSVPVAAGGSLSSERLLFSVSDDYHNQLETYGRLVRDLHHARVSAPTPLGWWSWTAYYFGLNQGTALTNSQWLAQHLRPLGYTFVHIDEGYQFARGEYATEDAALFPAGLGDLEHKVVAQGLTPGIWTAPFEVSERSWVFQHHPEWLVHNAKGAPIHLGIVAEGKDQLYALDTTHPGAQAYLRKTYSTLANEWNIRYIKLDFMEDSAVEGFYYVPNTTALEAQRVGIRTIREAVGEKVLLDKDGCELLNPVGLVDTGRISQDTGHTFSSSRDAAPGVAARYYMNRNYFIADADAFTVSRQTVDDQSWHGGQHPLTLDEAKVSIALTAISGGMFEIGDDLPTLGEDADRVALVENHDILDIAHLARAAKPIDLMSYAAADQQPSIFVLHEDPRQMIVTVFDWTESPRTHMLDRAALGLDAQGEYIVSDVFTPSDTGKPLGPTLDLNQPAHSVRMLKIVNTKIAATPPSIAVTGAHDGKAGETLAFSAKATDEHAPVLGVTWDFGDGVSVDGMAVEHAYTHGGTYTVKAHAVGIGGVAAEQTFPVTITGAVVTKFIPEEKRRLIHNPDVEKP
jgi:hypothetical protein